MFIGVKITNTPIIDRKLWKGFKPINTLEIINIITESATVIP